MTTNTEITLTELQSALKSRGVLLLEALPEAYFSSGHLPGARRIDAEKVTTQVAAMTQHKEAPIVVYCASATCRNSHEAAGALRRAGYTSVRVYADGKQGWLDAGLPLAK